MKALWWRFWLWLFNARVTVVVRWIHYRSGFTGHGTTALDRRPTVAEPWIPSFLRRELERASAQVAAFKRQTFREVCIQELGEDPDEWW